LCESILSKTKAARIIHHPRRHHCPAISYMQLSLCDCLDANPTDERPYVAHRHHPVPESTESDSYLKGEAKVEPCEAIIAEKSAPIPAQGSA
jgi:hypothetical protein